MSASMTRFAISIGGVFKVVVERRIRQTSQAPYCREAIHDPAPLVDRLGAFFQQA
jgi:hypothetical protein